MTKVAIYVISIMLAFLFAMTAPSWQVTVAYRGNSAQQLARQLWSGESRTPSSPVNVLQGRNIYRGICADCHGSGSTQFGIGAGYPTSYVQHAPRDIHSIISYGQAPKLPGDAAYSGQPFELTSDHPVFPAQLTDTERWAVAIYLVCAGLDRGNLDDEPAWLQSWRNRLNPADTVYSGVEIYRENCAACHGPEGFGNGSLAGDLVPHPSSLRDSVWLANQSDWYFYSVIREGRFDYAQEDTSSLLSGTRGWTGMPAWGDYFTDDRIIALVNHIRSYSYTLSFPERSIEDYEPIEPDYNRWGWTDISGLLPDAPDLAPEWMLDDTDQ